MIVTGQEDVRNFVESEGPWMSAQTGPLQIRKQQPDAGFTYGASLWARMCVIEAALRNPSVRAMSAFIMPLSLSR